MSGVPNPDGVRKLKDSLRDFDWTRDRIAELKKSISEQQKTLALREAELLGLQALIQAKLEEMDVSSAGNFGWERRYFELLLMMAVY